MIIAISGKSGCGNSTICRLISEQFSLKVINYTFRDYATEHGHSFQEMHALARSNPDIDKHIDERQVALSREGNCVVGSRLAIWLVENPTLRIYLRANLMTRARRIALRERRSWLRTILYTFCRDLRDIRRYRTAYNININNYHNHCDIVLNSGTCSPQELLAIISRKLSDVK